MLGLHSHSGKTSYRQISRRLETARFDVITIVSLRNLTGISAEVPVRFQSDWINLNPNLVAWRLREILWQDVRPLSEQRSRCGESQVGVIAAMFVKAGDRTNGVVWHPGHGENLSWKRQTACCYQLSRISTFLYSITQYIEDRAKWLTFLRYFQIYFRDLKLLYFDYRLQLFMKLVSRGPIDNKTALVHVPVCAENKILPAPMFT